MLAANGVCAASENTRFTPWSAMKPLNRVPCSPLSGCVRMMQPWCGSRVIPSPPETVNSITLFSQHNGATAVVTALAQVPRMAETLSTSISLRAAFTAESGLVSSSSLMISIRRPPTPPAALISATTAITAFTIGGPYDPPAPVCGVNVPNRIGAPWARAVRNTMGAASPPKSAERRPMKDAMTRSP